MQLLQFELRSTELQVATLAEKIEGLKALLKATEGKHENVMAILGAFLPDKFKSAN